MIDWIYTLHGQYDLRMSAVNCKIIGGKPVYTTSIAFGSCNVQQISPATNLPACYTT